MEITFSKSSINKFENAIRAEVMRRAVKVMQLTKPILVREAILLAAEIQNSKEWQYLKSNKGIAEFGFAPWEVADLDEIINKYLIPTGSNITNIEISSTITGAPKAVLHWCDWNAMLGSPFALHELTKRASRSARKAGGTSGGWITTKTVNWLEWLEYGVTIDGYDVEHPISYKKRFFSRSGLGLMIESETSWSYPGSYLFDRTAQGFANRRPALIKEFHKLFKTEMRKQ